MKLRRFLILLSIGLILPLCSCTTNSSYKDVNSLKKDFMVDAKEKYDFFSDVNTVFCLGKFNEGYLLTYQIIPSFLEVNYESYNLEGVEFKTIANTYFYFYINHKVVEGLERMVEEKLLDKEDLLRIKEIFDSLEKDENNRPLIKQDYFN